jgi:hypothetical protein
MTFSRSKARLATRFATCASRRAKPSPSAIMQRSWIFILLHTAATRMADESLS